MKIQTDVELTSYNTLRVPVKAKFLARISSFNDAVALMHTKEFKSYPHMLLGGGSNIIFTKDFAGLVIRVESKGIHAVSDDDSKTIIEVEAGEIWDDVVRWAVDRELSGIENLAAIPGTIGAAPVQNIGAYGQSLSESLHIIKALDLSSGNTVELRKHDCHFGYRQSIFKKQKNLLILKVSLELKKHAKLNTDYYSIGARRDSVKKELQKLAVPPYKPADIASAVRSIRKRKLIDPNKGPTIGSFFINPTISTQKYNKLSKKVSDLQAYPVEDKDAHQDHVKIPAGRLIDVLGWRGKKIDGVYMSEKWASIVTHDGTATGRQVLKYLMKIQKHVLDEFDIKLEYEPIVV